MSEQDQHGASAVDRLSAGAAGLRTSDQSGDVERLLLRAGMALPLIGLVLVLVAWYRAAGTGYVADQIPYLISGGLFGLGLVLVGLGLFVRYSLTRLFRFWLARLLHEHQAQTDRMVEAMNQVEAAIRDATRDVPLVDVPTGGERPTRRS